VKRGRKRVLRAVPCDVEVGTIDARLTVLDAVTAPKVRLLQFAYEHDVRYGLKATAAERRALANLSHGPADAATREFWLAQLWRLRAERRRSHEQRLAQRSRARLPRRDDLTEAIERAYAKHPNPKSDGIIVKAVLKDFENHKKPPDERTIRHRLKSK
jgi:hypothetical protein